MQFDIVIQHGWVADGTGDPLKQADIGIVGERIAAIGRLDGAEAGTVIDATGKIVAPGFIDVHVHSELALLGGPDRYAPLKMGVTTQLASPDGFSWAPLSRARLLEQEAYLRVFYGDVPFPTDEDMTLDRWLSVFRGQLPSNLVLQVPHASIRLEVMGWGNRTAFGQEMERMEQLVRQWMEAGAVAFCTGLDYEPMRRADQNELVRLSKVAAQYGGVYVAHQRGYGDRLAAGCAETFAIAEAANIPVHISHLPIDQAAGEWIERACARGIDVTFDMYPYPAGCTHLLLGLPEELQLGSPEEVKIRLADRSIRRTFAQALHQAFPPDRVSFAAVGTAEPTGWEGKTLRQVQQELGLDLPDAICDILLRTDFQALMIYYWPHGREPILQPTFEHPLHMVGTDGIYVGRKPHPRGYGTYPKILGEYVRDRRWLSLETAIYKMSGLPARRFRIRKRGVLMKHYFADIVVFDPASIGSAADFEEARQDPSGIDVVIVNGKVAVHGCAIQPGLFGRILN